jgi:sulfur carrier protein
MRVTINGEQREIASERVDALLSELDYEGTHFAIALNYDVLPKSRWAETALKAGEYELQPGLTPRSLLEHLSSGRVLLHRITFIEGATFADIRNVLATHEAVNAQYAERSAEAQGTGTSMHGAVPHPGTYIGGRQFAGVILRAGNKGDAP